MGSRLRDMFLFYLRHLCIVYGMSRVEQLHKQNIPKVLWTMQAAATFPQIEKRFSIGIEVATLSISLYILGLGIGPLFFGGLSEFLGRNLIYRTSFLANVATSIPIEKR